MEVTAATEVVKNTLQVHHEIAPSVPEEVGVVERRPDLPFETENRRMNLRRVVFSEANTEYGPAELLTAINQRGEITALLAVERNHRDLHDVRFRLDSVSRAVREFNDGVDLYLNRWN